MTPPRIPFEHTYAALPERLHAACAPTPVAAPRLVRLNDALARLLGLDPAALGGEVGARVFTGTELPEGARPLAMAYAGHQFGGFVPQLGDGRALLLGELVGADGVRRDVQLKGPGRTPYSRGGDGRCALGPALREYVLCEAMHALGVPTTRALAVATTGERVWRDAPLPGAVFTRVATSHLRVGTFQFAATRGDVDGLRALVEHAIARHDPDAYDAEVPALALLDGVVARQAALVARWMSLGFIHGVMNTDNTTISGETIDYGPCAFLDEFDPAKVFSSIDHQGRYAWGRQPAIMHWNLTRLGEALLPLVAQARGDRAVAATEEVLATFPARLSSAWKARLAAKLGLATTRDGDAALADALLEAMAAARADFTVTFRALAGAVAPGADAEVAAQLGTGPAAAWLPRWRARVADEGAPVEVAARLRAANPAYIPRNHRVEEAIAAAVVRDDFAPFHALVDALARPFDEAPERARYAAPPREDERVRATFCGT